MSLDIFKGVSRAMAPLIAKKIKKEDFLDQLRTAWYPVISHNSDIEQELVHTISRIKKSGFEKVFKVVGVTSQDIRGILEDIKSSKDKPVQSLETPGRNEPCICGSGSKYKRCCGK